MMKTFKWGTFILAGIYLLLVSIHLYATTEQDIKCALDAARKNLRISIATEERITSRLEELKKSGDESPDVIEDYELYLSRVKSMVAENRKVVAELEALNDRYDKGKKPDGPAYRDDSKPVVDQGIPEEKVVDEVAELDRQLDRSLGEFDEMLLRELDLILARSSEKMQDLASEAAAAAERLREQGIEIDTDTEEESAESGQGPAEEQRKAETEGDASEKGEESTSEEDGDDAEFTGRDSSPEGVEGSRDHPRNRYDPKDDDIVARQLREAAEKETDPELREKLWKEYEQYKKK